MSRTRSKSTTINDSDDKNKNSLTSTTNTRTRRTSSSNKDIENTSSPKQQLYKQANKQNKQQQNHSDDNIDNVTSDSKTTTTTTPSKSTRQQNDINYTLLNNIKSILNRDKTPLLQCERNELVSRLKQISNVLSQYKNDNNTDISSKLQHSIFNELNNIVLDKKLLNSKIDDIVVYTCMIISDLMRLYAPNSPYTTTELHILFNVICKQLIRLKNETEIYYSKIYYILETLCQIHCFAILVEFNLIDELCNIFNIFYELISYNINEKVEFYLLDTMSNLINEFDNNVPVKLLDVILIQLNEDHRTNNTRCCDTSIKLIKRCDSNMKSVITTLLYEWFINNDDNDSTKQQSNNILIRHYVVNLDEESSITEFTDRVEILYQLLAYCYDILENTIDDLSSLLTIERKEYRLAYVKMYGNLFTRTDINFYKQNEILLHEFLRRFNDSSVNIRLTMLEFSANLLLIHTNHRILLYNYLSDAMSANNEQIRQKAIDCVIEAGQNNMSSVSIELLQTVGKRLLDIKKSVHNAAAEGLAQLFSMYVTPRWHIGSQLSDDGKKLAWYVT